ncbi:MAG: DUF6789 family protein [Pseudomonadota bacterium]
MPVYGSHGMEPLGGRWAVLGKGIVAGFVATVALSVVLVIKQLSGFLPELNIIELLTVAAGMPGEAWVGWTLHFLIGTLAWGILFVYLRPLMPGRSRTLQAVWFGALAWLLMMIVFMPAAEAGLFGQRLDGLMVAVTTLVLHLFYGWVLGATFSAMTRDEALPASTPLDSRR